MVSNCAQFGGNISRRLRQIQNCNSMPARRKLTDFDGATAMAWLQDGVGSPRSSQEACSGTLCQRPPEAAPSSPWISPRTPTCKSSQEDHPERRPICPHAGSATEDDDSQQHQSSGSNRLQLTDRSCYRSCSRSAQQGYCCSERHIA